MSAHGVGAGRQHLWDFDISPDNRLATANAGPPVKKSNRSPKSSRGKQRGGRSGAEAVEETSEVDEPVGDMVWWEYGLGPQVNAEEVAPGRRGRRRHVIPYQQQEEPNEDDSGSSDDGYESNNEHVPRDEPGTLSV